MVIISLVLSNMLYFLMFLIYLQLPLCLCDKTISLCLYLLLFPSPSPCDHPCPQKPVSRVRLSERKEEEESMLASRDWNHISQLKIVTAQKLLPHFCPNMPQTFYLFAAEATRIWPFSCHVWLQMSCDCMSPMKLSKEWSNTNLLPLLGVSWRCSSNHTCFFWEDRVWSVEKIEWYIGESVLGSFLHSLHKHVAPCLAGTNCWSKSTKCWALQSASGLFRSSLFPATEN